GKGFVAKSNVALWRTRGEHRPLVGEFAYQAKFDREDEVSPKARKRCEQFFITLQHDAKDWVSLGTTKTGMVYGLDGRRPRSNEGRGDNDGGVGGRHLQRIPADWRDELRKYRAVPPRRPRDQAPVDRRQRLHRAGVDQRDAAGAERDEHRGAPRRPL